MNFLSGNLKFLRQKLGYTQAEICAQLGFKQTKWNNYEKGVSKPGLDDFIKIIGTLDVTASDLLERDLTKGEYLKKGVGSKKRAKGEYSGEYSGGFSGKNRPSEPILTVINEPAAVWDKKGQKPIIITVDRRGEENVLLVPVKARAGYLNGYADPEYMQSLSAYRLPGLNHGTYRLFEVEGASMYPTVNSGDLIIGSNVDQISLLRDDRVHVVVTKNEGVVVKRVLNRLQQDGKLILKSDNYKDRDLYPPIVVDPEDILEIWYATGYISRQMRPPADIYNRLTDLEGRFALMEQTVKKAGTK